MRRLSLISLAVLMLVIAGCQGTPPTQIVLVVTATPEDAAEIQEADSTEEAATKEPAAAPTEQPTGTPPPTDNGPATATPVVNQIQVAEQVFENGRMFWIQPTGQIWVMVVTDEGEGDWSVYSDTFEEGEPETDPQLTPPDGMDQPRRGFGKLWRENPEIREALGWTLTPEFGYVTRYEYHCLQEAVVNGENICQQGYHVLTSLYEESFRFIEGSNTWQLN